MAEMTQQNSERIFNNMVDKSNQEIFKISTVFPFKLFPTEIIVDEVKVTIIQHYFLYRHYFPVLIKDIKTITVGHGIFFASLKFEIQGYEQNPGPIDTLPKSQAMRAHQILVGLTALVKEKAEGALTNLLPEERESKLAEIGATSSTPQT